MYFKEIACFFILGTNCFAQHCLLMALCRAVADTPGRPLTVCRAGAGVGAAPANRALSSSGGVPPVSPF